MSYQHLLYNRHCGYLTIGKVVAKVVSEMEQNHLFG